MCVCVCVCVCVVYEGAVAADPVRPGRGGKRKFARENFAVHNSAARKNLIL